MEPIEIEADEAVSLEFKLVIGPDTARRMYDHSEFVIKDETGVDHVVRCDELTADAKERTRHISATVPQGLNIKGQHEAQLRSVFVKPGHVDYVTLSPLVIKLNFVEPSVQLVAASAVKPQHEAVTKLKTALSALERGNSR